MAAASIDDLPGFRRRLVVTPGPGEARSEVEDDYHRMTVVLRHDGRIAQKVEADMIRAPWTTCPAAQAVLAQTFTGVDLDAFARRGDKAVNCTHLHDLAVLAATHARDLSPVIYDILVSDPVEGRVRAELRRDGATVMEWVFANGKFVEPAELAGLRLDQLRPWIDSLDAEGQERARLLRWGTMLAHGRTMSFQTRSDKARLPLGQCHTFQPENAPNAEYIPGTVLDFSGKKAGPLAKYGARRAG